MVGVGYSQEGRHLDDVLALAAQRPLEPLAATVGLKVGDRPDGDVSPDVRFTLSKVYVVRPVSVVTESLSPTMTGTGDLTCFSDHS
jgi:hypothetical protein